MNNFVCNQTNAYHPGCLQEFGDFIRDHVTTIEGVGIGLAVIQVNTSNQINFSCVFCIFLWFT